MARCLKGLCVFVLLSMSMFVLSVFLGAADVSAERNTTAVCEYRVENSVMRTLPDGRQYVVMEYSVRGNDNARRFITNSGSFWTENGWFASSNQAGCGAANFKSAAFWEAGRRVELDNIWYQGLFNGRYPEHIIFGVAQGASFVPMENYNIPGIGGADQNNWRSRLGIDKVALDVFATINDGGAAVLNGRTAWCTGFNFFPWNCGSVDSGSVYPGGGDFAGYHNAYNANARSNVFGAFRNSVRDKTPINGLLGYNNNQGTNAGKRFGLEVAGMNTRDAVPPGWEFRCLNNFPTQSVCTPNFPDGTPIPEPFTNNKASIVLTYILPPAPPDFNITPTADCSISSSSALFSVSNSGPDSSGPVTVTMRYGIGSANNTETRTVTLASGASRDFSFPLGSLSIGDEIYTEIRVNPVNGSGGSSPTVGGFCEQVVLSPTLDVVGADVWAGGGYRISASSTFCDVPTGFSGEVRTNPTSQTNYAAFATANILGFGTGGNASTSPNGNILAFANSSSPPGNFNTQGKCVPDYFAELDKDVAFPGNFNTSGQFFSGSSVNINSPLNIPQNRKVTLIVDGDININNNIRYVYGALSSPDLVPSIVLVASGDINIAPNVTQLDGLYVAGTGDDPNNGVINTCYDASNPSRTPGDLSTVDECHDNRLEVYGAFQAKRIEFRRTTGDFSNPNERAERFFVTPEFYLSKPILESPFNRGFDVSSQQDLPPVQ